jgi:prepilin-type N-terminal cleavage/methylation domain-containing protein
MTDKYPRASPLAIARRTAKPAASSGGFTLVELLVVLAIVILMLAIALPNINLAIKNMHLGSAASSLAAAIQSARYQAISTGCPVNVILPTGTCTGASGGLCYQLTQEALTGTPPACASTFTPIPNIGGPNPYSTSDISLNASQTIQLNPSGTVTAAGSSIPVNYSLILGLTNGSATKTINVSGVGNVKVQ